jgi:hypothetical protein
MPLVAGDIVQVTVRSLVGGQTVLWLNNYRVFSTASTDTVLEDLAQLAVAFSATTTPLPLFYYRRVISTDTVISAVRAQRVRPTRSVFFENPVGVNGLGSGNCQTINVAATYTRGTELAGRNQISVSHIGPISPNDYASGLLSGGFVTKLGDLAARMTEDFFTTAPDISYRPVVLHKLGFQPSSTDIETYRLGATSRTMHRRTVGIGI